MITKKAPHWGALHPKSGVIYNKSIYEKVDFLSFFDVRASKWVQNGPQAQKQLQILKAHTFTFPMTYSKSGYENIDFMTFFDVRASKWVKNGSEG